MSKRLLSLMLMACWLSSVHCGPSYVEDSSSDLAPHPNDLFSVEGNGEAAAGDDNGDYGKRVERYTFGLGRRAYTYASGGNGIKRLPVYNFGLGKRARPYSFGLGKRVGDNDEGERIEDEDDYISALMDDKRNRPYSFGLGKRLPQQHADRQDYVRRYSFGLGR